MKLFNYLQETFQDLGYAVVRLFSPNDDNYPLVGVQPFDGKITRLKA